MGALTPWARTARANWSAEDVRARMTFGLRSAYAHGTRAIRTHLDSLAPQDAISFGVFRELREEWAGRIDLAGRLPRRLRHDGTRTAPS
jgi:cytosine/creatinine deaminase